MAGRMISGPSDSPAFSHMSHRLPFVFLFALALAAPAAAQDAAELVVRLGRLENQTRQMAGQIEQLQFENRQLKDQVRKFQEDVEFRFQDSRGSARGAPSASPGAAPGGTTPTRPAQPQRPGDAFEPDQAP